MFGFADLTEFQFAHMKRETIIHQNIIIYTADNNDTIFTSDFDKFICNRYLYDIIQIICDLWVLTFGRVHFPGLSSYISKTLPCVFTYPSKQPFLTIFLHSSVVRALFLGCLGSSVRASRGDLYFITFLCLRLYI